VLDVDHPVRWGLYLTWARVLSSIGRGAARTRFNLTDGAPIRRGFRGGECDHRPLFTLTAMSVEPSISASGRPKPHGGEFPRTRGSTRSSFGGGGDRSRDRAFMVFKNAFFPAEVSLWANTGSMAMGGERAGSDGDLSMQ